MKDTENALLQSLHYIKTEIQEFRKMTHKDLEKVKSTNAKQNIILSILFMLIVFVYYDLGFFSSNPKHIIINQTIDAKAVSNSSNENKSTMKTLNKNKHITNVKSKQEHSSKKLGLINK